MSTPEKKFELASDVSLIIAAGKLFLYNQTLQQLKVEKTGRKTKRGEMLKRLVLEYVSNLPDEYFFVPPNIATSKESVLRYLRRRFKEKHVLEKAKRDVAKLVADRQMSLVETRE